MRQIKANEIRLGNLFAVNGFPMSVEAIFKDTVYLNFEGNEGDVWEENIKDLVLIPLTEEILIKAGFEKESFSFYLYKDFIIRKIRESDKQWRVILRHKDLNDIEYLHQLQNLYFALTGEEIKIELV